MRVRAYRSGHMQNGVVATRLHSKIQIVNRLTQTHAEMTSIHAVTTLSRIDLIRVRGLDRTVSTVPIRSTGLATQMDLVLEDEHRIPTVQHLRSRSYALDIRGVGKSGYKQ